MELGRVIGSVWCTRKAAALSGHKLLLVERWTPAGSDGSGDSRVCADLIGAGVGERVLVTTGSSARRALEAEDAPVDAAVVAIVDGWEVRR